MPSLDLTHHPQQYETDCLPACAQIVLSYLGVNIRYGRLRRLLGSGEDGTPFANLERLSRLSTTVLVDNEFSDPMALLVETLGRSIPVIVSVGTKYLPYWTESTDHAIVVAGINTSTVSIYDPWFQDAPKIIERIDMESAWLESEFLYGVIQST